MIQGFKEFIARGNAMEMAVGIIIGAAFGNVITALVEKFINPLIGAIFGQPNFDSVLSFTIGDAVVMPGATLTALVNFLIVAFALYFFIVVPMNKLAAARKEGEEEEAEPTDVELLAEIRDLLKKS